MSIRVGARHMRRVLRAWYPKYRYIDANFFSAYNLCSSIPFEELTTQFTSIYVLCIEQKEDLTASFASTYSLATAPT